MAGTTTIRDIDATSRTSPRSRSTLNVVTVPMKQVAGVQTGIPNVYLEQPQIETVIENDLRLSVYDGLDELVRAATRRQRLPGTEHRQHPRLHPQVHHDAAGSRLHART